MKAVAQGSQMSGTNSLAETTMVHFELSSTWACPLTQRCNSRLRFHPFPSVEVADSIEPGRRQRR